MKNIKNTKFNKTKIVSNKRKEISTVSKISTAAAVVAASTLPISSAQAGNVGGTAVVHSNATATEYNFDIASISLSFDNTTSQGTIAGGAITNTANILANKLLIKTTSGTADATFNIVSVIMSADGNGGTEGLTTISDVDDAVGNMTTNIAGAFLTDGALTINTLEEQVTAENQIVNFAGATTIKGAFEIEADASNVTADVLVTLGAITIMTGGVDIADISGTNTATLRANGSAAQTITGAIDAEAAADGILASANSHASGATFASDIGATISLRSIIVESGLMVVAGNVSATTTTVAGTYKITGNKTHTGIVSGSTAGVGDIILSNATNASIAGDIGAATSIDQLILDDNGTNSLSVVTGSIVTANGIVLGNNANNKIITLNISNAAVEAVTGNITASDAGDTTTVIIEDTTNNSVADLVTVTGNIELAGAANFTVGQADASGVAKVTGDITSATVNVIGGSGTAEISTLTAQGNITGAINLNKTTREAVLVLGGTTAQTITGNIVSQAASEGIIKITNTGGTTITGTIGGTNDFTELEVTSDLTTQAIANGDLLDLDGTIRIGVKNNTIDDMNFGSGSELHINKAIVSGEKVFTLNNDMAAADFVTGAKVFMPINMKDGDTMILLEDTDGANAAALALKVDAGLQDTFLIDYSAARDAADVDDVQITATNKSAGAIGKALDMKSDRANGLIQAYEAAISDVNVDATLEAAFASALSDGATKSTERATLLGEQVAPQTDVIGGSTTATRAMTGAVQGIVTNRLASLRSGDKYVTGVAAGNGMSANSGFFQAFGSTTEQDTRKKSGTTVHGFDAETTGLAFGFDGMTDSGSVLGLSLSYSESEVDGLGKGKAKNDIESYTASIYADKSTESGYVEGSLTFGTNDNQASRSVTAEGLNRTLTGAYDSQQVSLKVGGGVPTEMSNGTYLTPFGSMAVTRITTDTYTEKSNVANDNLRLRVVQSDIDSVVASLGVKAHANTAFGTPMVSIAVNNEFGDTSIDSTNTYKGGGAAFKTSSEVEELSATLGLGYTYDSDGGLTSINLGYEAETNDDEYLSHYGSIKLVTKF